MADQRNTPGWARGPVFWAGLGCVAAAAYLLAVYDRPRYDTPCHTVVDDPTFERFSTCSISHIAAAGSSTLLLGLAVVLILIAARRLPARWRSDRSVALTALILGTTTVMLSWITWVWPEPVLRSGWSSARDQAALLTLLLTTLAVTLGALQARPGAPWKTWLRRQRDRQVT